MQLSKYLLAFALLAAAPAHSESLLDIYQRALQSDPLLREAEANRMASETLKPQAWSQLLPQVTASASETRADSTGSEAFTVQDQNGNPITTATTFVNRDIESSEWRVQMVQTIFRWDQIIGLAQADKRIAEAYANYEAAQQSLMLRVAERYFNVLGAQDALESNEASRRAIAKQLDQAQKRFEVGLVAITDVQEAQAAYDQSVADEISAKRTLASSKSLLQEIIGDAVPSLARPKAEFTPSMPKPADEGSWVETAMEQNLALVASRINSEIASKEVGVRRSGHYPTLDLVVGRSDSETNLARANSGSAFSDIFSGSGGDSISLQLSVPIFSGMRTTARVREAVYLHRAARERTQRIARETERQTRDAYLGVESDIARTNALKQSLKSSETALKATQAGFDVGTRTIVDVLNSQRALFGARTNYLRARYDYLLNVLRLRQAAGILSVQDLEQIESLLEE